MDDQAPNPEYVNFGFGGLGFSTNRSTTSTTWQGVMVKSGKATASVRAGDATFPAAFSPASVTVQRRDGFRWTETDWSFNPNGGFLSLAITSEPNGTESEGSWARVCSTEANSECKASDVSLIQPDGTPADKGYTYSKIYSGPNAGLYWITGERFAMPLKAMFNKFVLADSPVRHAWSGDPCSAIARNFYEFNVCKGTNGFPGFQAPLLAHEEAHFTQAKDVAASTFGDPAYQIEDLSHTSLSSFEMAASNAVAEAAREIYDYVKDHHSGYGFYSFWCGHPYSWKGTSWTKDGQYCF